MTTRQRSREQGYVLLVLVLFAAVLLAGVSTIVRKAAFEGQREREEELIFRGLQYQRAIQLYFRKFGRYPVSIDELEKTNDIRFLRKRYRDPMTGSDEWRLIHIGPNGVLVDALTSAFPPGTAPAQSGAGSNPSQSGQPSQPGQGASQESSPSGQQPFQSGFPSGSGFQSGSGQIPGQPPPTGFAPITPGLSPITPGGQQPGASGNPPGDPALSPSANPTWNPQFQPRPSAAGQQPASGAPASGSQPASGSSPLAFGSPTIGTGAIAGVASTSKAASIRLWNGYDQYDKWEFVFDFRQDQVAAAAAARMGTLQQQPTPGTPPGTPPGMQQPQPNPNFPQPGLQPAPGFPTPQPPGPGTPRFPFSPIPGGFPPPQTR